MSVSRWEHFTHASPIIRFSVWLFHQLGQMPYPGLGSRGLGHETSLMQGEPSIE